jgi:hypothetical protein
MYTKIERNEITDNQVWALVDMAGFYEDILIGNLDDLRIRTRLDEKEIDVLLDFGATKYKHGAIFTYNWKVGDNLEYTGKEYFISTVYACTMPNGFKVFLTEQDSLNSIAVSGTAFDLDYQRGQIKILTNESDEEEIKEVVDNSLYCNGNSDCQPVESYLPVSGKKFRVCKKHGKEIK